MKKGISVQKKFMVCMFVILMSVVFSAVFSAVNLNRIKRSSAEMMQNYMQIQKLYGTIEKKVETIQKYANILVGSSDEDLQIAGDIYGLMAQETDSVRELLVTLKEICGQTGREDIIEQIKKYSSGCEGLLDCMAVCADYRKNGDFAGAKLYLGTDALAVILGQEQVCLELEGSVTLCLNAGQEEVEESIHTALMIQRIISVVCVLCIVVSIIILQGNLLNPLKKVSETMLWTAEEIAEGRGNLTDRILVKRADEIGKMQKSLNRLLEAFCNVILQVKGNALYIEASASKTEHQVEISNDKIGGLSSVMEELATTSQEIATFTQQINDKMHEITEETREISGEMNHGTQFSAELKERAGYIRQKTLQSKKRTEYIANNIKNTIEKSISDSQNISKVSALTDAILEIAAKTNLLALNAAIEAARAGEAGKGFAVVADEIRALADNSKKNASAIQELNQRVIEAVHDLCKCSQDMVGFVDRDVMEDYKNFEMMTTRYAEDADIVEEIMCNVQKSVDYMNQKISSVSENIDGISTSIGESASGIQSAADSVIEISNVTDGIYQEMCKNKQASAKLKSISEGFAVE